MVTCSNCDKQFTLCDECMQVVDETQFYCYDRSHYCSGDCIRHRIIDDNTNKIYDAHDKNLQAWKKSLKVEGAK